MLEKPTIILVEDNDMIRGAMAEHLEYCGYRVLATGQPVVALGWLAKEPSVSLLATDYVLPEITGAALIRMSLSMRPSLPTLLVTARTTPPRDLPATDIPLLTKPFGFDDLEHAVHQAMCQGNGPVRRATDTSLAT